MPEFTYIPGEGAVETFNGRPIAVQPENAYVESQGFGTLEDAQDYQRDQTALGLAQREMVAHQQRGVSDEDLDNGTYNVALAALEQLLQEKQQELYNTSNPVLAVQLAQECEALAGQIVNGRRAESPSQDEEDGNTIEDQIRAEHGDRVNEILANAAQVLAPDVIEEYNKEVLADEDPLVKKAGFKTLQALQERPDAFNTDHSTWSPLTNDQVSRISEEFGHQRASEIQAISYAVATGRTTPAQALKLASKDPGLFNALVQGAARGLYKVMF
jgi:hypothetical protein